MVDTAVSTSTGPSVFGGVYCGPASDLLTNIQQPPCTSSSINNDDQQQPSAPIEPTGKRSLGNDSSTLCRLPIDTGCLLKVKDNANHDIESAVLSRSWSLRRSNSARSPRSLKLDRTSSTPLTKPKSARSSGGQAAVAPSPLSRQCDRVDVHVDDGIEEDMAEAHVVVEMVQEGGQRGDKPHVIMPEKERSLRKLIMKRSKPKCGVCNKKCSGDILRADDKYFHISCFVCKVCRRQLSEVGFFEHLGAYYCPADYQAQFGKKCPACHEFADGAVVECSGQVFHQKCFKCTKCSKAFANGEKVALNGRDALCQKCISQIHPKPELKPAPPPPVHQEKTKELISDNTEPRPISPPCETTSPTTCAECNQLIHSGQVLLALDCQWHIWCFKCKTCDSVLHGEYMAKDGKPYCIRDYNTQFGVRCYECDKYIAGRVLQAGQYQFHPACCECARCGQAFTDGEEMYMQGDDIWHARCNDIKPPDTIIHSQSSKSPRSSYAPKYTVDFGKLLTYMYLIPEPEMGYLKHPIQPHPPPPEQFHVPKGPVKIRKSRISMLKTGMQKLTEQLDQDHPRPKSPHMDNEEPIEMAHFPGGVAPNEDWVPPIDREDFPAPMYPYAVEELKRRLSASSIEDLEDDDDDVDSADPKRVERLHKQEEALQAFENESSIARVIKTDLEEQAKKANLPLHWDPRSASRTANAKKMPHLRCRYETPINASPSRYLNRPRPWNAWQADRANTTQIVAFSQVADGEPKPGYGLAPKSSTLPVNANGFYANDVGYDSMDYAGLEMPPPPALRSTVVGGTAVSLMPGMKTATLDMQRFHQPSHPGVVPKAIRNSLPDMSKPPKIYPYDQISSANKKLPEDVDRCHLERHLAGEEFEAIFQMTPIEFYKLPEWKRVNLKRKAKLF